MWWWLREWGTCEDFSQAMHSIIFAAFVVTVRALEEDPTTTYYRLYRDGTEFYTQKNFSFAKTLLEKSLEDYRFYHKNAINCRVECRRENSLLLENFEDSRKSTDILEIGLFENYIHQSKCMKRCFKKVFGERPDHIHSSESKRIDKDFETGRVYQYLQFCYYEVRGKCVFKGNNSCHSAQGFNVKIILFSTKNKFEMIHI